MRWPIIRLLAVRVGAAALFGSWHRRYRLYMANQPITATFSPGVSGMQLIVASTELPVDVQPGVLLKIVEDPDGLAYEALVLSIIDNHRFEALVDGVSSQLVEVESQVPQVGLVRAVPSVEAHTAEAFRFF